MRQAVSAGSNGTLVKLKPRRFSTSVCSSASKPMLTSSVDGRPSEESFVVCQERIVAACAYRGTYGWTRFDACPGLPNLGCCCRIFRSPRWEKSFFITAAMFFTAIYTAAASPAARSAIKRGIALARAGDSYAVVAVEYRLSPTATIARVTATEGPPLVQCWRPCRRRRRALASRRA
jgi:hypothetical protein